MLKRIVDSLLVVVVLVITGAAVYVDLLKRVIVLENERLLPAGTVLAYIGTEGDAMPNGWVECGSSGTPSMVGRFLLGTGQGNGDAGQPTRAEPDDDGTIRTTGEAWGERQQPPPEGADNGGGDNWHHKHDVELPALRAVFYCKIGSSENADLE